jgi:hypothetical protein
MSVCDKYKHSFVSVASPSLAGMRMPSKLKFSEYLRHPAHGYPNNKCTALKAITLQTAFVLADRLLVPPLATRALAHNL